MRLDRFITLNLVQPFRRSLLRIGWGEGERSPDEVHVTRHPSPVTSLPILMYHSISDDPEPGVRPYYRVCTSPQRFREQMQWLKDNGYQGVTLSAGLASLSSSTNSLSARHAGEDDRGEVGNSELRTPNSELRTIVLTFDDGFRDFHTAAWPILREFGFTATMYLPTVSIGDTRRQFAPSPRRGEGRVEVPPSSIIHHPSSGSSRDCLTWAEVNELHRAGIEFGSHTVHHPELVNLSWLEIVSEIRDSKSEIENRLGVPCATFAYPYAFPQSRRDFVCRFKDLLATCGYDTNVTTQLGRHRPSDDALQIKRLPVNQDDDLPLFAAKLAGAYDWLAWPQRVTKQIKQLVSSSGSRNIEDTVQPARHCKPVPGSDTSVS